MDTNNEILDAIEILADRKISENITKVLTGVCKSVNINKNTCVMDSNGVSSTVQFYGSPPEANELYRIFVPSNDMSRSFIIVPPRFTVNPNLLDNWYFGNPVNQRGQTSYTGNVYGVDRWKSGGDTISIVDTGVKIISTGPGRVTQQLISGDLKKSLAGKTVTFSVLTDADILDDWRITDTSGFSAFHRDVVFLENLVSWTFTVSDNTNIGGLGVWCASAGKTITLIAAKLELGPTQTLAHQDAAGNWVLNEVSEYGDQLRRCQRYFWRFSPAEYVAGATAFGIDANTARAMVYLPEQMRTSPALNLNASEGFFLTGASGDIFNTTVSTVWTASNSVYVDFKKSGAFEVNAPYFVRGGASAYIDISADL